MSEFNEWGDGLYADDCPVCGVPYPGCINCFFCVAHQSNVDSIRNAILSKIANVGRCGWFDQEDNGDILQCAKPHLDNGKDIFCEEHQKQFDRGKT